MKLTNFFGRMFKYSKPAFSCSTGLLKGSVTNSEYEMSPLQKLERPKTLRQLKTFYNGNSGDSERFDQNCQPAAINADSLNSKTVSILSPFDEQEEWAKISEIMASFGSSLVRESVFVTELEQEFQHRLGLTKLDGIKDGKKLTVGQWLVYSGFSEHEAAFINFGYDNIEFINGVINDCDLKELGIMNECDREVLLQESNKLSNSVGDFWVSKFNRTADGLDKHNENATCADHSENGAMEENACSADKEDIVKNWLESIGLACYVDTFHRHMYTNIEKIKKIWEVELTAVLEITKPGHRRRILASVSVAKSQSATPSKSQEANNLEDLNSDLNQLRNNLQQLKNEIRTKIPISTNNTSSSEGNGVASGNGCSKNSSTGHRHNHKKSRQAPLPPPMQNSAANDLEIRNPSELLVGVPSTLTAQWRHKPGLLMNGTINYVASYLGSTVVKELRGAESTKKSIQKLKKSTSVVDCRVTPEIILAISYRGVKFLNVDDESLICEHEIRNIHCACQDSEDLTHFAYITKDHATKAHYCHVFCVHTMDQATEVILTLGEAFEVAYQMALKEHFNSSGARPSGHMRSHSVNNITDSCSNSPQPYPSHSRSHSINNIVDSPPMTKTTVLQTALQVRPNNQTATLAPFSPSTAEHKIRAAISGASSAAINTPLSPSKAPIAVSEDM